MLGSNAQARLQAQQDKFEWYPEAQQQVEDAGLTPCDVTFREVLAALKSVSTHLDLTTERPNYFEEDN